VSLGSDASAAPLEDLVASLQDEHDVRREVCEQVVRWYGTVDEASHTWKVDIESVVRQIGLGVLRTQRVCILKTSRQHRLLTHVSISVNPSQKMHSLPNGTPLLATLLLLLFPYLFSPATSFLLLLLPPYSHQPHN
jgi:hypothetical protein